MSKDPRTRQGACSSRQPQTGSRARCTWSFRSRKLANGHIRNHHAGSHPIWQTSEQFLHHPCFADGLQACAASVSTVLSAGAVDTDAARTLHHHASVRLAEANADAMTQHACVNLAMPVDLYMRRLLDIVCCNMVTMIDEWKYQGTAP